MSPAPIHDIMAKAISDDELQLKKRARRRLVGAIALVLLVVVFLPMLLDNEPKPLNQDIAITIPPVPGPDAAPLPAIEEPASEPAPAGLQDPEPSVPHPLPGVEPQSAAPAPKPSVPAPKPATAAAKPAAKPAASEGFVVQLGAFSNAANATALKNKLTENKFKAYTETISSPAGTRTRVRVGPYGSRQEAERARDTLRARKLVIGDATVVKLGD